MAMSMHEMFYGERPPAYLAHYGRQGPSDRTFLFPGAAREGRVRCMELTTFDLMVPMCCARCANHVQEALLTMGGVRDVVCDARNQRVTVTGCVDPVQALKQARRVKNGATFWSEQNARRYIQRLCPAYRDTTQTHYISVNPTIATREEMDR